MDIACINQNLRDAANSARIEESDQDTAEADIDAIQANYVTTNTTQTITAQKTMQSTVYFASGTTYTGPNPSTPTANTVYPQSITKVYATFVGTGSVGAATILDSFNVSQSSVQKQGTGNYMITFDVPFANPYYAVVASPFNDEANRQTNECHAVIKLSTATTITCQDDADVDTDQDEVQVIIVGKQ